jgi:integrase
VKTCQLTTRKVSAAKEPGYYCDGGGLYLQLSKYGTKSWVFRFKSDGRLREMGLGSLHTFSLKEARERARECRQLVATGLDPIEERLKRRDKERAETRQRLTFKEAAERFLETHQNEWRKEKHKAQWRNTLRDYAYRPLGSRRVSSIDAAVINEALQPIWTKIPETARRVKQRIERVVQWIKEGMQLPRHGASKSVGHHKAMPFGDLPAFMVELRKRDSVSASALEFTILTAARTNETIGARWSEIDFDAGVWTVPASRMKAKKEHQVPLSGRALAILRAIPRETGSAYVFPGAKGKAPLSNMAMLELLRGMAGNGYTVHGFRSSFRDWAGDRTHYAREVIEHALAHQIKDKAEASYRRSDALEKRRKLMEAWARYCEAPAAKGDKIVALHGTA